MQGASFFGQPDVGQGDVVPDRRSLLAFAVELARLDGVMEDLHAAVDAAELEACW